MFSMDKIMIFKDECFYNGKYCLQADILDSNIAIDRSRDFIYEILEQ